MDTIGKRLFESTDMTGTLISEAVSLNNILHVSVHARWSGSPNGTLIYEVSGEIGDPQAWEAYDSASVGGAGTQYWIDRNTPYMWIRVRYVPSSGTGDLDVDVVLKGDK
jgi:hypothetical protein